MVDEPLRGGFPDPSFYSQTGIEQVRGWMRSMAPRAPLSQLTGIRATQVGAGTTTCTMPASPALQAFDGHVEGLALLQAAMELAVLTGAPAATDVRIAVMVVNHLRPCTVEAETLVAKGRTLHSGRTFTLADVTLEDALGRGVAQATGTFVLRAM
ncbi:MAG: PaaI family thioesterase, partial [Acidimicrobiia bacterium]